MKLSLTIKFYLAVVLCLSMTMVESRTHSKSHAKTTYWVRPLIKTAKSYLSFANLAYCPPGVINKLACPLCSSIMDGSYKVVDQGTANQNNNVYNFVILVSEAHKEYVLSFSGPKSKDAVFYSAIYQSGFSKIHGAGVEKAFLTGYSSISQQLHQKVQSLNPNGYSYKFIGHSFGGSLAVLAAYDLINSNLISATSSKEPIVVYSYGQLRIGDEQFVEKVNSLFKVVRIVKNSDHMTRLPNCVFSNSINQWRCYRDTYDLYMRYPENRRYLTQYAGRSSFRHYTTGIQAAYGKTSFMEKSSRTSSKSHSKAHTKAQSKAHSKAHSKRKGYYYTANNPGIKDYSHGTSLINSGAKSYGNVYYTQPMGAEVLFTKRFNRFTVCSYYSGVPNCERQLPRTFSSASSSNYYNQNVDEC